MKQRERDQRNLSPTPEAVAAMYVYSRIYAAQKGGCMDFWDSLPATQKLFCKELVEKIIATSKRRC